MVRSSINANVLLYLIDDRIRRLRHEGNLVGANPKVIRGQIEILEDIRNQIDLLGTIVVIDTQIAITDYS